MNSLTTNQKLQTKNWRPKVAIVHDWLIGGGAERVVEQLHEIYPDAPIYTSYATKEWREKLDGKVKTSYLQHLGRIRKFLPILRGLWFSRLKLDKYDLVISSSGAEAKFIKVRKPAIHIAYIHAPTHYYWSRYDQYMNSPGFGKLDWLARFGLKIFVGPMRKWDFKAAQRPDFLIANSTFTKNEIKKYYGREADVVFPPVDVERFTQAKSEFPRKGFVIAGRQTPYKRFDIAVQTCSQLNIPLLVIGRGPDQWRLKRLAGRSITFLTKVSDHDMPKYFAEAEAFIFPGVDDFGIVAVEAIAAGTPVIAYHDGGALDYVRPGKTGEFFNDPTSESLAKTLQGFRSNKFSEASIKKSAQKFSATTFRKNFQQLVKNYVPRSKA